MEMRDTQDGGKQEPPERLRAFPAADAHSGRVVRRGSPRAEVTALVAALFLVAAVRYLSAVLLRPALPQPKGGVLLPVQLAAYDGQRGRPLYLAVMGEVYDVTAGMRHYGPKGGYGMFAAKDASRAYVTGKFRDDLSDDVADFSGEQMQELARWRDFYAKHKEYTFVAKLVGRFYDASGNPTPLQQSVEEAAAAAAAEAERQEQEQQGDGSVDAGVPCNVKWSKAEGGSVWCPDGQHPRRVLQSDWQGGEPQERCVCTADQEVSPAARLYDGCPPDATRCRTSQPEAETEAGTASASASGAQ